MNKNNFSINLAKIRKRKGLSQRDLADKCGISQRIIAHYETHAVNPSISKIEMIADALGVTAAKLLSDFEQLNSKISIKDELENVDIKTLKRLKQIVSLSPQERNSIYTLLDAILAKKQNKKEKQLVESAK